MATILTPKEIALKFGTDAKTLRKFLRAEAKGKGAENPGKGGRWAIQAGQVKGLQKRFDAWNATKGTKPEIAPEAPASTESDTSPESDTDA